MTDITYVRTWEGWLYVAVVLDLFSRKVIGWAARQTIHRELVLDTILMAMRQRKPNRTIVHSDQGSQYGSDDWRRFCRTNKLEPSMSQPRTLNPAATESGGDVAGAATAGTNAVAESFFSSLKKERIKKRIYKNRQLAVEDVSDYIDAFYNRTRRHQHLGGVIPDEFEAAAMQPKADVH